jgi:tRNA (cmo5U34)-methyltransferase
MQSVVFQANVMTTPLSKKSTIEEIRKRFDADVDRFSNLQAGQAATIDAPLSMDLITKAAVVSTPTIKRVLDIGCGAGNNIIRLVKEYGEGFACDLCDLSRPMLERARQRVCVETNKEVRAFEGDFRTMQFDESSYDVVLAAAVLHHLRDEHDWEAAFRRIYALVRPGGSFWVTDLVTHENESIHRLMWERYGKHLEELGGPDYRQKVFGYIDKEDSPRPLTFQLDLMRRVGFQSVEILHKNSCFAAFGGLKGEPDAVFHSGKLPPRW